MKKQLSLSVLVLVASATSLAQTEIPNSGKRRMVCVTVTQPSGPHYVRDCSNGSRLYSTAGTATCGQEINVVDITESNIAPNDQQLAALYTVDADTSKKCYIYSQFNP